MLLSLSILHTDLKFIVFTLREDLFPTLGLLFLLFIVIFLVVWFFKRYNSEVKLKCWACHNSHLIVFKHSNSWFCPGCQHYNGFKKDGDYNIEIPGQKCTNQNHPNKLLTRYTKLQSNPSSSHKPPKLSPKNVLCKSCNHIQPIKMQMIRNFKGSGSLQLKKYTNEVERLYPMCPPCQLKVQTRIQEVDEWVVGENHKSNFKVGVAMEIGGDNDDDRFHNNNMYLDKVNKKTAKFDINKKSKNRLFSKTPLIKIKKEIITNTENKTKNSNKENKNITKKFSQKFFEMIERYFKITTSKQKLPNPQPFHPQTSSSLPSSSYLITPSSSLQHTPQSSISSSFTQNKPSLLNLMFILKVILTLASVYLAVSCNLQISPSTDPVQYFPSDFDELYVTVRQWLSACGNRGKDFIFNYFSYDTKITVKVDDGGDGMGDGGEKDKKVVSDASQDWLSDHLVDGKVIKNGQVLNNEEEIKNGKLNKNQEFKNIKNINFSDISKEMEFQHENIPSKTTHKESSNHHTSNLLSSLVSFNLPSILLIINIVNQMVLYMEKGRQRIAFLLTLLWLVLLFISPMLQVECCNRKTTVAGGVFSGKKAGNNENIYCTTIYSLYNNQHPVENDDDNSAVINNTHNNIIYICNKINNNKTLNNKSIDWTCVGCWLVYTCVLLNLTTLWYHTQQYKRYTAFVNTVWNKSYKINNNQQHYTNNKQPFFNTNNDINSFSPYKNQFNNNTQHLNNHNNMFNNNYTNFKNNINNTSLTHLNNDLNNNNHNIPNGHLYDHNSHVTINDTNFFKPFNSINNSLKTNSSLNNSLNSNNSLNNINFNKSLNCNNMNSSLNNNNIINNLNNMNTSLNNNKNLSNNSFRNNNNNIPITSHSNNNNNIPITSHSNNNIPITSHSNNNINNNLSTTSDDFWCSKNFFKTDHLSYSDDEDYKNNIIYNNGYNKNSNISKNVNNKNNNINDHMNKIKLFGNKFEREKRCNEIEKNLFDKFHHVSIHPTLVNGVHFNHQHFNIINNFNNNKTDKKDNKNSFNVNSRGSVWESNGINISKVANTESNKDCFAGINENNCHRRKNTKSILSPSKFLNYR